MSAIKELLVRIRADDTRFGKTFRRLDATLKLAQKRAREFARVFFPPVTMVGD